MENKQNSYKRILRISFYIVSALQIFMGLVWFIVNIRKPESIRTGLLYLLPIGVAALLLCILKRTLKCNGFKAQIIVLMLFIMTMPSVIMAVHPEIISTGYLHKYDAEKPAISMGFLLANHTLTGHLGEFSYYLGNDLVRAHGDEFKSLDTNPSLMYLKFGNWIREEYPEKDVREYHYYWLSKGAFGIWKRDIVTRNTLEIIEYTFTPFAPLILEKFSVRSTNLPMIKKLFTENLPGFSNFYYRFSFAGFLVLSVMALFINEPGNIKRFLVTGLISVCIALTLWWFTVRGFDPVKGAIISVLYGIWLLTALFKKINSERNKA